MPTCTSLCASASVAQFHHLAGQFQLFDDRFGGGAGAERVREHLKATREIVEFQMGIPGSLELAATIAEVLAFHVAEEGDGIVWFYHREFAAPDRRAATLWKTE